MHPTDSITAVKRHLSGAAVCLLIASGALASACNVSPTAATANGTTISTGSLNSQLRTLESTQYGACLLQLENPAADLRLGPGRRRARYLHHGVRRCGAREPGGRAARRAVRRPKGLTVSSSDLSTARSDFAETLDGEISAAVQQSTSTGSTSFCERPRRFEPHRDQLLHGLPSPVSDAQVLNQAYDEKLLADGADLSADAILRLLRRQQVGVHRGLREPDRDRLRGCGQSDRGPVERRGAVRRRGQVELDRHPDSGQRRVAGLYLYPGCGGPGPRAAEHSRRAGPRRRSRTPERASGSSTRSPARRSTRCRRSSSVVRRELLQATANVDRVSKEIIAFAHRLRRVDQSAVRNVGPAHDRAPGGAPAPVPAGRRSRGPELHAQAPLNSTGSGAGTQSARGRAPPARRARRAAADPPGATAAMVTAAIGPTDRSHLGSMWSGWVPPVPS